MYITQQDVPQTLKYTLVVTYEVGLIRDLTGGKVPICR
jgi:hypothetical protein